MRSKWLLLIVSALLFALITACDDQGTTSVSLPQDSDTVWFCDLQPNDVLELASQTIKDGTAQWSFVGLQEGDITVCFSTDLEADDAPYMSYTYHVDDLGQISTTSVSGSVVATKSSTKSLFHLLKAE